MISAGVGQLRADAFHWAGIGTSADDLNLSWLLWIIGGMAIVLRIAAAVVLHQPLDSDALAYFTMAQGLAEHGTLADQFGQHAFYSAGYPLLLAPAFLLFGASVRMAIAVNCGLAVVSLCLIARIATLLAGRGSAGPVAAAAFACWLPAIWTASGLAKENLSTPLLLALAYCTLRIARGAAPVRWSLGAGLTWGGSLLTGGSSLLLCAGVGVALVVRWRRHGAVVPAAMAFLAATALVLVPWLYTTNQTVGRPVLTTNAAFNLYLGNNPAATGRFVSMRDTPIGTVRWNQLRSERGEAGAAAVLGTEARTWIAAHPAQAIRLAALKLWYFWQPNLPDAADFTASRLISAIRLIEVAQYVLILAAGLWAIRSPTIGRDDKWIVAALIAGFWVVHAAAYIIARYRDPVVPLVIAMGAGPVAHWLHRRGIGRRAMSDGV